MRILIAVGAALGALGVGCDRAERTAVAPKAPYVSTAPDTSKPKTVSEVLIRYCSS